MADKTNVTIVLNEDAYRRLKIVADNSDERPSRTATRLIELALAELEKEHKSLENVLFVTQISKKADPKE
jgi:hypothetical protein